MNRPTYDALKKSIRHWKDNVAAKTSDYASVGWYDCALCKKFYPDGCGGCPVSGATGHKVCHNTPYGKASVTLDNWRYGSGTKERFRKAAQKELEFLQALVPAGGRP